MKRINITLFTIMLLGILFSCTKASLNYTQNGNWVNRASFPGVPMGNGASFTIGDHAYIGTGTNPLDPNNRLTTMYRYTAATIGSGPNDYLTALGSWTQTADFPGQARASAVGFAVAGIGYMGSGLASNGYTPLSDFYAYDPNSDHWTQIDSIHDAVKSYPRFDAVAWGFDTVGYVLTGTDLQYYFLDVWKYSPTTGHWTKGPFMPGNARSGAATWVYKGQGYLLTGYTPNSHWALNNACYDFWKFNPAATDTNNMWIKLNDLSNTNPSTFDDGYTTIIRNHGAAFTILGTSSGDKGYITLGANGSAVTYTWEYDFAADLWTEKTPYEGAARTGAIGFSLGAGKRGFVTTGLNQGSTAAYSDLLEFFPNQIYNQYD